MPQISQTKGVIIVINYRSLAITRGYCTKQIYIVKVLQFWCRCRSRCSVYTQKLIAVSSCLEYYGFGSSNNFRLWFLVLTHYIYRVDYFWSEGMPAKLLCIHALGVQLLINAQYLGLHARIPNFTDTSSNYQALLLII